MVKQKQTIRDIARLAGVSHMTVSRVLNDDTNVKPETRKHVLAVIRQHDFTPNPKARAFSSNRSRLIGLLVSDISNPFYAELAKGIEKNAYERGYNIIFCSETAANNEQDALSFLLKSGVDGLIFASTKLHDKGARRIIKQGFPTVLVNRKLSGDDFNYVVCDNRKGAEQMTAHLFAQGYHRIAIITGPSDLSTGVERLAGYYDSHKGRDIPVNADYTFQGPFDRETGYKGANRFIKLEKRPQAIFAGNDYIAMGVLDALEEAGLRVPQDIAVVGFDNTFFAAHSRINLTTVSQRTQEMGALGVNILIESIEGTGGNYNNHIVLKPEIIIRKSCGQYLRKNI